MAEFPYDYEYDFAFSFHVESMRESVLLLKRILEAENFTVWTCLDIPPGENFRHEISHAIRVSKIFVPFMNSHWARSGECEFETNHAVRRYLTSRTDNMLQTRLPIIIPIAFSNLVIRDYPHIEQLAANFTFIMHDAVNLQAGNVQRTQDAFLDAVKEKLGRSKLLYIGDNVSVGLGYKVKCLNQFSCGKATNKNKYYIQKVIGQDRYTANTDGRTWELTDLTSRPTFGNKNIYYVVCNKCGTAGETFYGSTESEAINKSEVWFNHVHLREFDDPMNHIS